MEWERRIIRIKSLIYDKFTQHISDRMIKNVEMIFYLLDSILNLYCIFDMGRNALLTNAL